LDSEVAIDGTGKLCHCCLEHMGSHKYVRSVFKKLGIFLPSGRKDNKLKPKPPLCSRIQTSQRNILRNGENKGNSSLLIKALDFKPESSFGWMLRLWKNLYKKASCLCTSCKPNWHFNERSDSCM